MSSLVSSLDNIVHLHLTPIRDNLLVSFETRISLSLARLVWLKIQVLSIHERKGHFRNMCRTKKKLVTGQQKKVGEAAKDGDNLETATMEIKRLVD